MRLLVTVPLCLALVGALVSCGGGSAASASATEPPTNSSNPSSPSNPPVASFTPLNPVTLTAPRASARIFISGHSLTDNPMPDNIQLIAQSMGKGVEWNQQNTPGAPIQLHTKGLDTSVAGYPGYSAGKNKSGSGMNIINEFLSPQTNTSNKYDTLILAERHDSLSVFSAHNTVKYARHFHERLIGGNPAGKTFISHSWWNVADKSNPSSWIAFERTMSIAWQGIASRINISLVAEGRSDRVDYLPAGLALAYLVEKATLDNVDGITGGGTLATVNRIFADNVHLTPVGVYYMSLVNYASVYRSSPVGAAYPTTVTAQQAAALQAVAWAVVSNHYANTPLPNLEGVRAAATNFASVYGNYPGQWQADPNFPNDPNKVIYISQPQSIATWANLYTSNSTNNPFYYNAATDSSYWLPAP